MEFVARFEKQNDEDGIDDILEVIMDEPIAN